MNWMDSVLKRVQASSQRIARQAAKAPAKAPARSSGPALRPFDRPAAQKKQGSGWSNLMLEIKNTIDTPLGTHYKVEPAKPPKDRKLSKEEQEWSDIKARQTEALTGEGAVDDPAKAFKENSTSKAERELQKEKGREEAYDAARLERAKILGVSDDSPTAAPELQELTADQYNKLTGRQKAAVDYNTILSEAVAKDLANQDEYKNVKGLARKTYDVAAEELFGKDRGSDLYAPETLAVLRQLNLKDELADLDDYLGLKTAITEDDLGALASDANRGRSNIMNGSDMDRADYVGGLADKTEKLQQSLAEGNKMLQNFNTSSLADRVTDIGRLGGNPDEVDAQLGFGTGEVDQYFQGAFDVLGNAENEKDRDQILSVMKSELKPDELDAFFQYADVRSKTAAQYNLPLGATEGVKYRTPDEFRKILGLGE